MLLLFILINKNGKRLLECALTHQIKALKYNEKNNVRLNVDSIILL